MSTPVHIVKFKNKKSVEEIFAVFDSKDKAKQFIGDFKSQTCLEIVDGILNPDLVQAQPPSPYYISLEKYSAAPRDIFLCDYNCEIEATRNEEHNICFSGGIENQQGLFISKVYAATEELALEMALRIRDEAIANGDWDRAWERHTALKTLLNRKTKLSTKSQYI